MRTDAKPGMIRRVGEPLPAGLLVFALGVWVSYYAWERVLAYPDLVGADVVSSVPDGWFRGLAPAAAFRPYQQVLRQLEDLRRIRRHIRLGAVLLLLGVFGVGL